MGVTVLDAGIVIAILDDADAHHEAAKAALNAARTVDELVLPASAYAEILVLPSRLGPGAVDRADEFVDALPARVEPVSRAIARAAARLRAARGKRLKLADSLVIATAEVVAADRILTTDRGWPDMATRVEIVGATA
ncbi:MAG: type II toxin-antitoxin system VapC family toxin [Chloroflexi bacterium]|nr:type II toxin-antitoxin system VapC family toxin [Chloroflexota bacterium]